MASKKHIVAKSLYSEGSLTVDGPSTIKGALKTETIIVTSPAFPTTSFPVADSLLPVGPPGNILRKSAADVSLTVAVPDAIYTWDSMWTVTPSADPFNNISATAGTWIDMGVVLDQADYEFIQLGFLISGQVTTSALAGTSELRLRIVDEATNAIAYGTNFSVFLPSASTVYLDKMMMTDYLTPAQFEADPNRRWQIQLLATGLDGVETVALGRPNVHVFMANAKLVDPA
jgi:hypothetical protein